MSTEEAGDPSDDLPRVDLVRTEPQGRAVGSCPNCAATVEECAETEGLCCFACSHWRYGSLA